MDSILLNLQVTTLLCMQGGASGARMTLTQTYTTLVGHIHKHLVCPCVWYILGTDSYFCCKQYCISYSDYKIATSLTILVGLESSFYLITGVSIIPPTGELENELQRESKSAVKNYKTDTEMTDYMNNVVSL